MKRIYLILTNGTEDVGYFTDLDDDNGTLILMMLFRLIRIEVLVNLVVAAGLLVCSAWQYLVSLGLQGASEGKHICQKVLISEP